MRTPSAMDPRQGLTESPSRDQPARARAVAIVRDGWWRRLFLEPPRRAWRRYAPAAKGEAKGLWALALLLIALLLLLVEAVMLGHGLAAPPPPDPRLDLWLPLHKVLGPLALVLSTGLVLDDVVLSRGADGTLDTDLAFGVAMLVALVVALDVSTVFLLQYHVGPMVPAPVDASCLYLGGCS